ncbi:unnamed protein product [Aspergillus oryzae]|nr:unnamed protein product [Aspergillus oryzae]
MSDLKGLFPSRFDGEATHSDEGSEHESTGGVDGGVGVCGAAVDGDEGGAGAGDTVETAGDAGSGAAVGGGEDLRGVGVEDAVHDVLEEGFEGGADELDVGVCAGGEAEEEDAGDQGGDDHCALAADVFDVDGVAGQDGAGDADDGGDGVVAVHGVGGLLGAAAGLFEVLGEEGVEEGRLDTFQGELGKVSCDDLLDCKSLLFDFFRVATDLVEDVLGEPGLLLVLVGNAVDSMDSLGLATTREQELRRLVEVEEEETTEEHGKGQSTQGEDQVSPPHVILLGAALDTIGNTVAGRQVTSARVCWNVGPCEQTSSAVS